MVNDRGIERFLSQLPGIAGYRAKETRREVDKRIRQQLMEELEHVRNAVSDIQRTALRTGGLRWMNELEGINSRLTLLIDKVRSAAYGYRPLFDLEQVKEGELDELIRFDREILSQLPRLNELVQRARETASQSPDTFGPALRALYDAITDLLNTYNQRDRLVRKVMSND